MHRKAAKLSKLPAVGAKEEAAEFEIRDLKLKLREAEYHYRFALKLRKNFPLTALNLGALQYVELNQLAPALETYKQCGFQMDPSKAKSFNQHVSTQVECLISGSRILLAAASSTATKSNTACSARFTNTNKLKGAKVEGRRKVGAAMTEQTLVDDDGNDDETAVEEKFTLTADKGQQPLDCVTLLKWTDLARAKANQVVASANVVSSQDPNKQLATIHWIRAHCICGEKENQQKTSNHLMVEPQEDKNYELKLAFEYAKRSQVPIDSSIYISYVDDLLNVKPSNRQIVDQSSNTSPEIEANPEPEQVLEEAIYVEHQKLLKSKLTNKNNNNNNNEANSGDEIAKLYLRLAKLMIARSKLKQMDEMLALSGHFGANNFNLLSQAAQLGYETKQFERSEKLYLAALELVMRDSEKYTRNGRKLASAHANLGAIVQVRGRLEEALAHYRKALDYDPNNRIAATNLSRLVQKVGSKLARRK